MILDVLNGYVGSFLDRKAKEEDMPELIYGFADVSNFARVIFDGKNLECAISVACALDPASVASLFQGLTRQYSDGYEKASSFLSLLASELVADLRDKGFEAMSSEDPNLDCEPLIEIEDGNPYANSSSSLLAKSRVFAAHAGLGWLGKNGLIVTKHYGPAVVLSTTFTNAPFDCSTEVFLSRCGRCTECAQACPVHAINVSKTAALSNIDEMVDTALCEEECHRRTLERFGKASDLCGICIYACPYTKSYLSRKGFPYE